LKGEEITVRHCRAGDVPAVLDLWAQARSEHASTPDRADDVERLVEDSPAALLVAEREGEIDEYLSGCGARRVTALVAIDDEVAGGFWGSAGYPVDREIGRMARNLQGSPVEAHEA
jgi:hypothetical protein